MPTAEIHDSKGKYAGYARFSASGEYMGSAGGYRRNGSRATSYSTRGETTRNGGSFVQNTIRTAGARGAARNPFMRG